MSASNPAHHEDPDRDRRTDHAFRRAAIETAQEILEFCYSPTGEAGESKDLIAQRLKDIVARNPHLSPAPPTVGNLYPDFIAVLGDPGTGRRARSRTR
ncbi:hypothetical protein [Streptomyces clavuligerus]|uniref:Uncharacterized protein n=1 Tax=Streptomyces clavuligerus TaxID=1901 RepID=Q6TMP3_STRCL|nr:hypothetical protein [Streptomyces clavuligerus]AAQ93580.1 hypothetical protein pSCL2.7.207.12 [Streptomyces clavuligerus]AXU16868.1 hypothetical protein D1794_29345 [Streptomyces clavuligerus]EDY48701.1 conserved hypothetical protein [Streptomyces clavuligerus]MBY6301004.1 hypothetical protein [Streptomyces clavuligerus]QPJ96990.1 hypothetical protein GE265_28135 [Streptomyces clavuligerus]